MKRVLKRLIILLVIAALGVGGYFGVETGVVSSLSRQYLGRDIVAEIRGEAFISDEIGQTEADPETEGTLSESQAVPEENETITETEAAVVMLEVPEITVVCNTMEGVHIEWKAVEGADAYQVYRSTDDKDWEVLTESETAEYADTDVTSGQSYSYTIACLDTDTGELISEYDSAGVQIMYVAAPAVSALKVMTDGIELSWNSVDGAENYRVYRKTVDTEWTELNTAMENTYVDNTVESGTEYCYTISCVTEDDSDEVSACSQDGSSIIYVAPPEDLNVANGMKCVELTWTPREGIEHYQIYRRGEDSEWEALAVTDVAEYADESVENGVQYSYSIACMNAEGTEDISAYNPEGYAIAYYDAPENICLTNTKDSVSVTWNSVEGISGYQVLRRGSEDTEWQNIGYAEENSYDDTDVAAGETYAYTAACCNADGITLLSACDPEGSEITYVTAPQELTLANKAEGIELNWQASEGAEKYVIWRSTSAGKLVKYRTTSDTKFVDSLLKSGTKYTYSIQSVGSGNANSVSELDENGCSITYVTMPKGISVSCTGSTAEISWEASKGAELYRIFRRTNDGKWSVLAETTETDYSDASVSSGNKYTYTVRCMDASAKTYTSVYDTTGVSVKFIAAPSGFKVKNTVKGVSITWTASKGASRYRIFRKSEDSNWKKVGDSKEASFTDTKVTSGDVYTYTVRCLNKDGSDYISTYDTKGKSIMYLDPITKDDLKISNSSDGVKITWNAIDGADKYYIYQKSGDDGYSKIGEAKADSTSYKDKTAKNGTKYAYAVRAVHAGSKADTLGGFEGKYQIWLAAPTDNYVTPESSSSIKVTWSKNKKADGTQIQYSKDEDFSDSKKTTVEKSESKKIGDLSSSTKYYVRVRAYKKSGDTTYYSAWSNTDFSYTKEVETTQAETKSSSKGSVSNSGGSSGGGTVYWTTQGSKYHTDSSCWHIRGKKIYSGTIKQSGKSSKCADCP